jgi:REP element-mobilizing transposase RayT
MVIPHRKPNRLKNFDYSENGWYFVTICTKDRKEYFGHIVDNRMVLNIYGIIVKNCWLDIQKHFPNVELHEFAIMPNHIHGIIVIRNVNHPVGAIFKSPVESLNVSGEINFAPTIKISLSNIIKWYKSKSTINIRATINETFCWQKSFYDHIIRNEYPLFRIRKYIKDNPINWREDRNNQI